jgi:hypothetical protein
LNFYFAWFESLEPKLALNCIFLGRRIELKAKGMKWKSQVTLGAGWKFCSNIHFNPQYFFGIKWLGPWISRKYILVPNSFSSFFPFLFRESSDSSLERESGHWGRFQPLKWLIFVLKGSIWWGGLHLGICFYLQNTSKNISQLGKNFCFGWIFGFWGGFLASVAMNWFNKVFMVFPRCFGSKMDWKWDF